MRACIHEQVLNLNMFFLQSTVTDIQLLQAKRRERCGERGQGRKGDIQCTLHELEKKNRSLVRFSSLLV